MRIGIAHHYGWAVAVTADESHAVVDRRRVELIEPGLPAAPVHHEGGPHEMHRAGEPLSDRELRDLVDRVRASVVRSTAAALDELANVGTPRSLSIRAWPPDFPTDITRMRVAPYESRADSVMYLRVLAEQAVHRGWEVHHYDASTVETDAASILGERAHEVLHGPRRILGAPWSKDHRQALAATVLAANQMSS